MLVSMTVYCTRRILEIYKIVQLVVSIGTRLVLIEGKNYAQCIAAFFVDI